MRGDQLARQWRLLQYLLTGRQGKTARDLALDLDSSVRSVYRDLEALQQAGFPLFSERDGRQVTWRVMDGFKQGTSVPFTPDELMALEVARDLMRPVSGTVFGEALDRAAAKIHATLPDGVAEFLLRFRGCFCSTVGPVHDYGQMADRVHLIRDALKQELSIKLVYHAFSTGKSIRRTVDPYGLYFYNGTLYLVAFCHLRKAVRLFTVDRIHEPQITDQSFERKADFDLGTYVAGAFGAFVGKPQRVQLRFTSGAARYIRERIWHPSQQITEAGGGTCLLDIQVPVSGELESWILSWGYDCQVLEPAKLRKHIHDLHHAGAVANRPESSPLGPMFT